MAIVALSASPATLDSGGSEFVTVTNTGAVDVTVSRGSQSFTLRPNQSRTVYPEGAAVTAVSAGTGQVTTLAQAAQVTQAQQVAANTAAVAANTAALAGLPGTYASLTSGNSPGPRRPPRAIRTLVTSFQSGHGWTAFTGTSGYSIADDTSDYELGTQARRITLPATASASASDRKTGLTAVDYTGKHISMLVKVDRPDLLATITLYLGDTGMTNFYALAAITGNVNANATVLHTDEWQWVNFTFASQSSTGGTPSKSAITDYQVSVAASSAGTAQVNVRVGAIGYFTPQSAYPNGVVSFTFDDSYVSQFTNALPVLDKYGYPANTFNIIDKIDASGGLTTAHLERMQEKHGWSIGAHAYTTANHNIGWTGLTTAQVETELYLGRQWLRDRGFRGADAYAYPGGLENKAIVDLTRKYHSFARVVNALPRQSTIAEELGLRIRSYALSTGVAPSTITGLIDSAYTNGWWLVIYAHDVVSSGASGSSQYNKADLQTIADYCNTKPIPVRTVEEVMANG